uniref:Ovule protein n=1 Tax=Haemonchus placei TaxID=6290 RepID=A0A0N4VTG9_HAEPC
LQTHREPDCERKRKEKYRVVCRLSESMSAMGKGRRRTVKSTTVCRLTESSSAK